jgi:hypothetical protein
MNTPSRAVSRSRFAPTLVTLALLGSLFAVAGPASPAAASSCPRREAWHPAGKAQRINGWLHTCGTKIVNNRGRIIRPDSVGLWNMASDVGRNSNLCRPWAQPGTTVAQNVTRWGFNSVLLYISWANVENRRPTLRNGHYVHHYNQTYLRAIDATVSRFASRGVKVILAMANNRWSSAFTKLTLPNGFYIPCGYGMPSWLYKSSSSLRDMVRHEKNFFNNSKLIGWFARAWHKVAYRYRQRPGVIGADVLHEPYDILAQNYPGSDGITPKDLHLAHFYERVGRAIHRGNRHLLVITTDYLSRTSHPFWALTRKPKLANAVYGFEFYAKNWSTVGLNRMKKFRRRATNWHRPVWVEEFFAYLPTGSGPPSSSWKTSTYGFLKYTKNNHIGWSFAPYSRLADPNVYPYVRPATLLSVLRSGF